MFSFSAAANFDLISPIYRQMERYIYKERERKKGRINEWMRAEGSVCINVRKLNSKKQQAINQTRKKKIEKKKVKHKLEDLGKC